MVSTIERFHCIQDSQLGPNGVLYREVLLYTGQPAGPNGALYREVPLYTGQPAGPNGVHYREVPQFISPPSLPTILSLFPFSDSWLLANVDCFICLDALAGGSGLYFHVAKVPKEGSALAQLAVALNSVSAHIKHTHLPLKSPVLVAQH